jgi:hypothetical protein
MITFKSPADLNKLSPDDPVYPLIKELVESLIVAYTTPERPYLADDYGWIILIEEQDVDAVLEDMGCKLTELLWEGAAMRGNFYLAIYLANDDFGISYVIPDAPWVNGKLRKLLDELVSY